MLTQFQPEAPGFDAFQQEGLHDQGVPYDTVAFDDLRRNFGEAPRQADLFGNPRAGESSEANFTASGEDVRLLVGRVLVETAAMVRGTELAGQLASDAERYMSAWQMQAQFRHLMEQNGLIGAESDEDNSKNEKKKRNKRNKGDADRLISV